MARREPREPRENRDNRGPRPERADRPDRNSRQGWRDGNTAPRRDGAKPHVARNNRKPRRNEDSLIAAINELGK